MIGSYSYSSVAAEPEHPGAGVLSRDMVGLFDDGDGWLVVGAWLDEEGL